MISQHAPRRTARAESRLNSRCLLAAVVALCGAALMWIAPTPSAYAQASDPPVEDAAQEAAPPDAGEPTVDEVDDGSAEDAAAGIESAGEPGDQTEIAEPESAAAADGSAGPLGERWTEKDWGRFQPVADVVEAGGPIIIILAILSVVSLAIILVKLIQFTALRPGDHGFLDRAGRMIFRRRRRRRP